MKFFKRFLTVIVILLILGVGFLLAAPILFKDQIVANVKSSVNGVVDAKVDFRDINLSFLKSFPDVSLTIDDLEVIGIDTFANLPLLTAKEARVDVGFWSVVGGNGNYNIDEVVLDEPFINLKVLTPELANYLIVPESESAAPEPTTSSATAQINLSRYEVKNGHFIYDDKTTETYLEIVGLNTTGDGDFTSTIFDLDTHSDAEALTLKQAGVAYLNEVKTKADALVNIDLNQNLYTFKENEITLNALSLVFGGSIDLEDNDDIIFDLDYSAPVNDFRQLWSLIPSAYTQGYEQVQTKGNFTLNGTVDGPYNGEKEIYPAFTVNTDITSGSVQYPGRPVGINGIDAKIAINSPSADLNKMVIDIPRFDFNLGGDPFRGRFKLSTPLSDPQVDARVDGKLDLAKWSQAIPLEGVRELAGVIVADITLDRVRQSLLDAGRYGDLNLSGIASITDFAYVADELPPVRINNASADFNPQAITISNFDGILGRSDLKASGNISTPLAYFSPDKTMQGNFTVRSNYFDADEWMPAEETDVASLSPAELETAAPATDATTEIFDRFDFNVDAEIKSLNYAGYRPTDLKAVGNVKPNRMEISAANGTLGQSAFAGTGTVTNLFDYSFGEGVLGGNLSVRSSFIDLADFMSEEAAEATAAASTPEEAMAAVPIPDNINLKVDLNADKIKYDNIDLNQVLGKLVMQGGQAVIEDGSAALLGGRMNFAGAYDTSEPGDPGFRVHYDLQSLDFNKAFSVLNSFATLAPVGKFLRGQFSTDMVLEGKLGPDLFPKLETIDAKGLFKTAEARLANFKPVNKIGQSLNIEELKESTVFKNLVTIFQIQEGKVSIEPFNFKLAGIPMQVQGRHGLNLDMDYAIRAAIPRDKIKGNIVTGTALSALDQLAGQAGKLGLNISPGDTLNVNINLLGSISDPQVKFNLLGSKDGGPTSVQDAVVGAVTDRVKEEVDTRREEAEQEVQNRVDAVRDDAQRRIDSLKNVATDRARLAQDSIRRAAEAETARLKELAAKELRDRLKLDSLRADSLLNNIPGANRIKEELEKFNPFKKKKKPGGGK
ncbi:MAG: AsmA-like C-terminal region-containing protein [Lewinella sp.]